MAKNHLKRISAPKAWPIPRKERMFIARPNPGAHKLMFGMPVSLVMTDFARCAKTKKEVNSILQNKNVLVDGKRVKDNRFMVGIMDTISLPDIKEYYRMMLDEKGKLMAIKIDEKESLLKPSRIEGKTMLKKGLIQLNMVDGRNIIVKKDEYSVGDTLVLSLPKQEIKEHIKLENGAAVYLTGGNHIGEIGVVESIEGDNIKIKSKEGVYETAWKYAFAVGTGKPMLKLS